MNTTITMPPTRVSQDELDRARRLGGEQGSVYLRLLEQRQDSLAWEAERDQNEARLRQAREARQAADAKARADAREAERAAAMDALKASLRTRFFAANPEASESDYQRVEQRMLDDELVARAQAARNADAEALRRTGSYQM